MYKMHVPQKYLICPNQQYISNSMFVHLKKKFSNNSSVSEAFKRSEDPAIKEHEVALEKLGR